MLQALKSFPNVVGVSQQWSRLVWLFLDSCGSVCLFCSVDLSVWRGTGHPRPLLAQDVQVDWSGFSHGEQDLLNVLNVQSLLRFPLPAAQHDVIHLLRTNPRPLQNPTLGYALNNLHRREGSGVRQMIFTDWLLWFVHNEKAVTPSRLSFEVWTNETEMKEINRMHSLLNLCNIKGEERLFFSVPQHKKTTTLNMCGVAVWDVVNRVIYWTLINQMTHCCSHYYYLCQFQPTVAALSQSILYSLYKPHFP